MAFLQRSFANEPNSPFTSLFRLLDDYDSYSNSSYGANNRSHGHRNHIMKTFHPKFDVREVEDAYEFHGELPGIDQKDVEIEFVDTQTLTIKGRTERSHQSGTPPAAVEAPTAADAIEDAPAEGSHKAKVEDEDAATEAKPTEIAKAEDKPTTVAETKKEVPLPKYWVSERSVGEFSRSFTFPVRVDQDAVTASMKNGVLSIAVPKAKKHESRKITIA